MKRGFFSKGTACIRNPIPEGTVFTFLFRFTCFLTGITIDPFALNDMYMEGVDHCPDYGLHVFKARIVSQRPGPLSDVIFTQLPPSHIDSYGSCQCFITTQLKHRFLATPNFPSSPPAIPISTVYELRATEWSMGRGMFALQPLNVGDLILVERPILLMGNYPTETVNDLVLGVFEATLEVAFSRMTATDQEAYRALSNAHKNNPTLTGIFRTNSTHMNFFDLAEKDFVDLAVFRTLSRINHSDQTNCDWIFDHASFSIQIRASRRISQGEEILVSRCDPTSPSTCFVHDA